MTKKQFLNVEVIDADRDQEDIFIIEIQNMELKDDEIRDVQVDVKVDKYDIQIKVNKDDTTNPPTPTVYFKPVWPTKFNFRYDKDKYIFPSDIYAQFDDHTILHFESQRNGLYNIAKILLNPVSKSSPKKVTFSSDTASLSDTNDIDL